MACVLSGGHTKGQMKDNPVASILGERVYSSLCSHEKC